MPSVQILSRPLARHGQSWPKRFITHRPIRSWAFSWFLDTDQLWFALNDLFGFDLGKRTANGIFGCCVSDEDDRHGLGGAGVIAAMGSWPDVALHDGFE